MAQYVIATVKSWNIDNCNRLMSRFPDDKFYVITEKEDLTAQKLRELNPRYVFLPHWSWIIPEEIYNSFECVVFHMTDLPFGRGGSPLQNLIVRGIYDTKVSAIRVEKGVDTGAIYLKKPVDISVGNVDDILSKVSEIVFGEMIPEFIAGNLVARKQEGEVVTFKRRTPEQSEIPESLTVRQIYDYIRMLDGEGYPAAYKDMGDARIYFRNARMEGDKVYAETEIIRRDE